MSKPDRITKAFPRTVLSQPGMDLRDYLAAKALGLHSKGDFDLEEDRRICVIRCYRIADAMMEAREDHE